MPPLAIIEHFDVIEYAFLVLLACLVMLAMNALGLKVAEKTLPGRVVPEIILAFMSGASAQTASPKEYIEGGR